MRVLVMGAGAMGTVVGGFLARAGHDVILVGREAHMAAIRANGLRIGGIWGDHLVKGLAVSTRVDTSPPGPFDLILITVKSYDTAEAAHIITPLVNDNTLICSYQNGLGNAEAIADAFGSKRTVGARAIFGAWLPKPGCAEVTVIAEPTALGVYDSAAPAERVRAIAAAMDAAGLPTVYTDDIRAVLWAKVAYNCALNPLSALLDVPYGALAKTEHTRSIIRDVIAELYRVGEAAGVNLKPRSDAEYLDLLFEKLIPPTAAHYASMREDFRRKRRTEIDALNGAICRYGARHQLTCPTNTVLTGLVHAREHALGIVQKHTSGR